MRAVQVATVLPICALTLATGGDDLPVLALCLLALACCATGRFGAAGLAVGAAAALKLFALPVVAVLVVLALATGNGRRFLPGALGLPVLALLPPCWSTRDAFVENVLRFPLGHGLVTSPAQSPFPGYLIAAGAARRPLSSRRPAGRGRRSRSPCCCIRRPPRTAATAALFCGYGLLAAILLMPTTRFGYLLYPLALPRLGRRPDTQADPQEQRHHGVTRPCTVYEMQMTCPKCHGEMRVYERSGVTVDQCTECRGIFLDRGELEKLFEAEANWNSRQASQRPAPGPGPRPPAPGGYAPPPRRRPVVATRAAAARLRPARVRPTRLRPAPAYAGRAPATAATASTVTTATTARATTATTGAGRRAS